MSEEIIIYKKLLFDRILPPTTPAIRLLRCAFLSLAIPAAAASLNASYMLALDNLSYAMSWTSASIARVERALDPRPAPLPIAIERTPSPQWTKDQLVEIATAAARAKGIDPDWVLSHIDAENGPWNPEAENVNKDSGTIDRGLMQVNSLNVKKSGYRTADMYNPVANTDLGTDLILDAVATGTRYANGGKYKGRKVTHCNGIVSAQSPRWLRIAEFSARTYNGGAGFPAASPEWKIHTCKYADRVLAAYISRQTPKLLTTK